MGFFSIAAFRNGVPQHQCCLESTEVKSEDRQHARYRGTANNRINLIDSSSRIYLETNLGCILHGSGNCVYRLELLRRPLPRKKSHEP